MSKPRITKREKQILEMRCEGHSTLEIAAELGLSRNTVARHLQTLHLKFDVHRSAELVNRYREVGADVVEFPVVTLQHAAHNAVSSAIHEGLLKRQPCEVCGEPKTHAHHDDYSKALDVRWLCRKHHREHHASHGRTRSIPNPALAERIAWETGNVLAEKTFGEEYRGYKFKLLSIGPDGSGFTLTAMLEDASIEMLLAQFTCKDASWNDENFNSYVVSSIQSLKAVIDQKIKDFV